MLPPLPTGFKIAFVRAWGTFLAAFDNPALREIHEIRNQLTVINNAEQLGRLDLVRPAVKKIEQKMEKLEGWARCVAESA